MPKSTKETYAEKFSNGNTWGRPRIYKTEDELANSVLGYFQHCEGLSQEVKKTIEGKNGKPDEEFIYEEWIREPEKPTITGLCLFLGFDSRGTFDKQAERTPDFSYIVKRAKAIIENRYEGMLSGDAVAGPIFALKNMGWKDKHEIDTNQNINHSGGVDVRVEIDYTKLSDDTLADIIATFTNQSREGESGAM